MSEEMAAPVSGAPPAATDHEFSSHQEGPLPVAMNNTSRRSTLSKSYLDVNVRGTTTPHSVNRHSHVGDIGLENYFVCLQYSISEQEFLKRSADERTGRPPRYGRSFEITIFPTNAWECYAENDIAAVPCRRLGYMHHLHFEICQTAFVTFPLQLILVGLTPFCSGCQSRSPHNSRLRGRFSPVI
jgi:hypothetical protein